MCVNTRGKLIHETEELLTEKGGIPELGGSLRKVMFVGEEQKEKIQEVLKAV